MKRFTFLLFSVLIITQFKGQNNYISEVWSADLGNGKFKNPILYADYSDPDVIRVGDDFFMTASSFNEIPGLPILHSKDMINWTIINHAINQLIPKDHYQIPQRGNGVWAPSIKFHNNEFYIYWGDPDFGIFMVKTKDPFGKWDEPILVLEGKGLIDPTPFWDEDGRAYIIHAWAGSRAGVKSLLTLRSMNTEGTKIQGKGTHIFDGHDENPTVEGPKMYKRNGYYYIFAPAGGVATGWQLVLRSKNIEGPYDTKIVLEQGSTKINGPHQGAWVETANGEHWFYHFQDADVYGRILHLQPMKWINDWPFIGIDFDKNGIGEPVSTYQKPNISYKGKVQTPNETDEFDDSKLGLQWQWSANEDIKWYSKIKGSSKLRLFSIKLPENSNNLWNIPHLLSQKFPAPNFVATTSVSLFPEEIDNGKTAGLIIIGTDYQTIVITRKKDGNYIQLRRALMADKGQKEEIIWEEKTQNHQVFFRVKVSEPNGICQFSYSENGKTYHNIGNQFEAKPGKWIGAKIGIYSTSTSHVKYGGYADFDYFRITKN